MVVHQASFFKGALSNSEMSYLNLIIYKAVASLLVKCRKKNKFWSIASRACSLKVNGVCSLISENLQEALNKTPETALKLLLIYS